jgi:FMN phosphatase YigB (HAD superfamily)
MSLLIFDLDDTLYDTSNRLDPVMPNYANMRLYPEALEILRDIPKEKVLVTFGKEEVQKKKIETLKIEPYFKEIYIFEDRSRKLEGFRQILEKYNVANPKEVIVIGDRIDTEIRYGNMLGVTTVHLNIGKYRMLMPKDELEIPTHTVNSLTELRFILN